MKKREITPLPEGFADLVASKSGYAPTAKPQSSLQLLENEMRVVNTQLTSARQGGAGNVRKLHEAKLKLAKEIEEAKASNKADQAVGDTKMPNVEANVKTPEGKADKESPKRKGDQAQADSMEKVKEDLDEGYNESACVGEMKKLHASACSKTEMYNKVSEKYGCSQAQFDELYAEYCKESYKEEKELDDVDPKAVKKKFANRKDKDLDNDGDTDSSDEYLHKRRKAISQALNEKPKKPSASVDESTELQGLDAAELKEAPMDGMCCKDCGDNFGKPKSESCMYNAYDMKGKNWIKKESYNEESLDEDAKMAKQSDENLKKLHKQFKAMNQQTPSTQHMMKRITKEMKRRKMTVEEVELDEAKSDYTINHKTFSSAVQHAVEVAKKRGYEVDEEDYDRKVAMGPRKPGKGKTNSYSIDVTKNGKPVKQKLQMQVYYDQGRYELNMYIQ